MGVLIAGICAPVAVADSSSAGRGSIDEAVARSGRLVDVSLTVDCNEFGEPCAGGSVQLYAGPRQAKVVRPAKMFMVGANFRTIEYQPRSPPQLKELKPTKSMNWLPSPSR